MFKIPINDERIQSLTKEQIDFMIYSNIIDDPEKLSKLENYYYDPDFDKEFDNVDSEVENPNLSFIVNDKKVTTVTKDNNEDNEEEDEFLEV